MVSIKTGVAAGDALIVDGVEKVQDGAKVEPTGRPSGAGPAGAPPPGAPPRPPAARPGA
jgi:hypothetical protein